MTILKIAIGLQFVALAVFFICIPLIINNLRKVRKWQREINELNEKIRAQR
jgi:uncharacterized protein YoxC